MRILASQYISTTAIHLFLFFKVDKPFTLVQCECMLEYEHLIRHQPGADSAHAQVRPEPHTLISVFKLKYTHVIFASLNI